MIEQWTEITTKVHTINDRKYAKGVVMTPAQTEKIEAYIKTEYKKKTTKKKITGEAITKAEEEKAKAADKRIKDANKSTKKSNG